MTQLLGRNAILTRVASFKTMAHQLPALALRRRFFSSLTQRLLQRPSRRDHHANQGRQSWRGLHAEQSCRGAGYPSCGGRRGVI